MAANCSVCKVACGGNVEHVWVTPTGKRRRVCSRCLQIVELVTSAFNEALKPKEVKNVQAK
jgi:hypothetical protein